MLNSILNGYRETLFLEDNFQRGVTTGTLLWHHPCRITAKLLWNLMRFALFIRWLSVYNVTCSNLINYRVGNSNWTVNYVADAGDCSLQSPAAIADCSDVTVTLMSSWLWHHSCCNASVKFYEKLHYLLDSWMVTTLLAQNLLILEQVIQIWWWTRWPILVGEHVTAAVTAQRLWQHYHLKNYNKKGAFDLSICIFFPGCPLVYKFLKNTAVVTLLLKFHIYVFQFENRNREICLSEISSFSVMGGI